MLITEIVSLLHRRNPKYTPTEILAIVNDIHYKCVSQEIDAFIYLNSTTGMPPFLATTASTYTYDCPSNCRKTSKLGILKNDYDPQYNGALDKLTLRFREFKWGGDWFYEIPNIIQSDAVPQSSTLAKVIFSSNLDPGTSTEKYYHFYWILPDTISDLEDQLQIPTETHFDFLNAISACLAMEDYGSMDAFNVIERLKRDIRNRLAKGAGRHGEPQTPKWLRDF